MSDTIIKSERRLLSKFLANPEALIDCDLVANEFFATNHQEIYKAIRAVDNSSTAVDIITVAEWLNKQTGQEWLSILGDIAQELLPSSENVKAYSGLVRDGFLTRESADIGRSLTDGSLSTTKIDEAISSLMKLSQPSGDFEFSMNNLLKQAINQIDEASRGIGGGMPTGIADLDQKMGGLHDTDLIIVGARPAMGKTALLLNFAKGLFMDGIPVGIFSGEQPAPQMAQRLLSICGSVPATRLRDGKLVNDEWGKLERSAKSMMDKPLYIYDKSSPSLADVMSVSRKWKHQYGIKAIFIDYLQRMTVDKSVSRHEGIGEVARGLKSLARDLEIPVIALAQVNREVDKRSDKRPHMGDLKDCGEIEQEADQILLVYRDEVYNPDTQEKGIAELLLDKNRHGPTGYVRTYWRGEYMRFDSMTDDYNQAANY